MLNCEGCSIPATGSVPVNLEETATAKPPLSSIMLEHAKILAEISNEVFSLQDRLTGCKEKRNIEPPPFSGLLQTAMDVRSGLLATLQAVLDLSGMIG